MANKKIDFYFDISSPYSYLAHTQIRKYEKETGDMEPNDPIGFHEWYQRYVRWLEKQVEKQR